MQLAHSRYALSGIQSVSCGQDRDQELAQLNSLQGSSCQELAAWVRPREALFSQLGLFAWLGQVAVGAITAGQEAARRFVFQGTAQLRSGLAVGACPHEAWFRLAV